MKAIYNATDLKSHEFEIKDEELEKALANLKLYKSPGCYSIPSNVVKVITDETFSVPKHIFNLSLNQGIFLERLKIVLATPIYKNGNESFLKNYRPISMLARFSKLLERIVYNRIYKFLDENHFGFQAAYSTEYAILQLRSLTADSCKSGKFTLGIFTDFSKPFDTVDGSILIKNLRNMELKIKI